MKTLNLTDEQYKHLVYIVDDYKCNRYIPKNSLCGKLIDMIHRLISKTEVEKMNIRDFEHKVEHQSDVNFDLVLLVLKY